MNDNIIETVAEEIEEPIVEVAEKNFVKTCGGRAAIVVLVAAAGFAAYKGGKKLYAIYKNKKNSNKVVYDKEDFDNEFYRSDDDRQYCEHNEE